jgi:hypothetical protein
VDGTSWSRAPSGRSEATIRRLSEAVGSSSPCLTSTPQTLKVERRTEAWPFSKSSAGGQRLIRIVSPDHIAKGYDAVYPVIDLRPTLPAEAQADKKRRELARLDTLTEQRDG